MEGIVLRNMQIYMHRAVYMVYFGHANRGIVCISCRSCQKVNEYQSGTDPGFTLMYVHCTLKNPRNTNLYTFITKPEVI